MSVRAAVVLAAGAARRMGQPKPLLAWHGGTLLGSCLRELRAARVERIVVVLGLLHEQVRAAVPEVESTTVVLNLDEASERSGSIRLAADALDAHVDAVLVQSVDQPCAGEVVVTLFETQEREHADVVVPTYGGRRGHPICLSGTLVPALRQVDEASEGLRAVVRQHQVLEVPVDSESVTWNLNDPDAYAAALAAQQQ
jgi:molybdenum cofactor cytidylyltransferase